MQHTTSVVRGTDAQAARALAEGTTGAFRAPHYTASPQGMREEVWLAAGGVLFLDDAANLSRAAVAAIAAAMQQAPLPPRYVVVDCTPLRPVGLGEKVSQRAQRRHTERLDEIVEELRDALGEKEAEAEYEELQD